MSNVPVAERTFYELNGLRVAAVHHTPSTASATAPASAQPIPVVLLHGWGASSDLMLPVAERLYPLGYTVYTLDLPGFGASDIPPNTWSIHDYAKFIIAFLDQLAIERVHLVGHSFGGRISLVLGADYPQRVAKLALADSAGVPTPQSGSTQLRLRAYRAVRQSLERVGAKGSAAKLRSWYNNRYGSSDLKGAGALRETFLRVVNEDLRPYAARVAAPTLLFWGDQDEDTPLWQGEALEKLIPDAGLIVYPGAGHYSYLDRLPEFVRTLDHFFKT